MESVDPPVAPVRKRRASVYDVEEAPIKATEAAVAAEVERARVAFASPQPSEDGEASEVRSWVDEGWGNLGGLVNFRGMESIV